MRMQVILDSSFARPGSAPTWGGKKGEFRDWTNIMYTCTVYPARLKSIFALFCTFTGSTRNTTSIDNPSFILDFHGDHS